MKRIWMLLIILTMLLTVAGCIPRRADKLPSEGLTFALSPDGASYIVNSIGTCKDSHVIIPSIYEGKPVTGIGRHAFFGCTALTGITIPDSITAIESSAFERCTGLTEIRIPDSVISIGSNAFSGCTGLTAVTIPDGITYIGDYTFSECIKLTAIVIPGSVTRIGDYAFSGCTALAEIHIPAGVTRISAKAFGGCTGLTRITVDSGNGFYHSTGNCIIETGARKLVVGCKSSIIPADGSVWSIGDYAFARCTGLMSITIPYNVTFIYPSAFQDCTGLAAITVPRNVTHIFASAFQGCTGLSRITFTGTKAQWNAIEKGSRWNDGTGNFTVYCTDGNISKADS